jgi:hypothetical protein
MNNYNEQLTKINKQIEELNKELDVIQANLIENENKEELGLISIVDDALKIELLIDKDLFNEEDINELTEIANQLQLLIVRVAERVEKKKKKK